MVQVSLEDLLTAGRTLSEEIIERIDQKADYAFQNKPQQEEFITREETCKKLGVSFRLTCKVPCLSYPKIL